MKIIISDSSTLILLQKIDLLHFLLKNHELFIPNEVYKETVEKGKERLHEDAFFIEEQISKKKIFKIEVKNKVLINKLILDYNIHKGEAEAIALFLEIKADILAVDDHKAITLCRIMKIPFMTAISFILYLFKNKILSKKESQDYIALLQEYGRYRDMIIIEALKEVS